MVSENSPNPLQLSFIFLSISPGYPGLIPTMAPRMGPYKKVDYFSNLKERRFWKIVPWQGRPAVFFLYRTGFVYETGFCQT
jgi:hypothetical protein